MKNLRYPVCVAMSFFVNDRFRFMKPICNKFYVNPFYIVIMGISGAIFAFLDVLHIANKPILPKGMSGPRLNTEQIISKATERDLRLIITVMTVEFCLLVAYSALSGCITATYPWFTLQTIVIILETVLFIIRFYNNGCRFAGITSGALMLAVFTVFNWLQVLCHIRRQFYVCDY